VFFFNCFSIFHKRIFKKLKLKNDLVAMAILDEKRDPSFSVGRLLILHVQSIIGKCMENKTEGLL
jgi:hypothetical protein